MLNACLSGHVSELGARLNCTTTWGRC